MSSTPESMTQDAKGLPSSNIYQSAKECTLESMIQVMCYDNYSALLKPPHSTEDPELIHEAWQAIYCEFCDVSGGAEIAALIQGLKSKIPLAAKIERVATLLSIAETMRHEGICDELIAEGYTVDFNAPEEDYMQSLRVIVAHLKADQMRLEQLQADDQKPKKASKKPEEKDFISTLWEVASVMNMPYQDPSTLTVLNYAVLINKLRLRAEGMTPKPKNNGR